MLLTKTDKLKVIDLFRPELSIAPGLVTALNFLFVEIESYWIEDYVLEVIDYFPIKVSIANYPKHEYKQLTLF